MQFGITSESPHREHITVRGVSDTARSIEHARDTFLIPVAVTELFAHQVAGGAIDGSVTAAGSQKSQQRPRRLHHTAAIFAQCL